MSRYVRRRGSLLLALLLSGAALAEPGPGPDRFRLAVDIGYGVPEGPARTLRRIADRALVQLAGSPCFSEISRHDADKPSDLLLRVRLDEFEDMTSNEASINERVSPNANPMEIAGRVVATVSALTRIDLRLADESQQIVRSRRFLAAESWRPQAGEDPHAVAEDRFVERVTDAIESLTCKGGPSKLARAVEKARSAR